MLLWPIPLLNVLHVESAAVVAFVAYFVSGGAAVSFLGKKQEPVRPSRLAPLAIRLAAASLLPAAMLTVSILWAPNCGYALGAGLYLLFVPVSAVLGVAVAYGVTGTGTTRPGVWTAAIGVAVALGGPAFDLGVHPQFYTYNHVFGGVLGPIYDEQLAVRPGLFWFRGMTLLWIAVAVLVGAHLRGIGGRRAVLAALACGSLLAGGLVFRAELGVNTTADHLRTALGGHVQTEHFDLYFDPEAHDARDVQRWARDHEYAYARLADALDADPAADSAAGRIQSYVYPSPERKADLTGARTTSVAPVWLPTAQMHMLVSRVQTSLDHELAHVFSRPYGMPVIRASWAVGLVEGWAVALEPPGGRPAPSDIVLAARGDSTGVRGDLAEEVAARLSPFGFWTGRGAVSYTTMGAFTSYLLDTYGPDPLKEVYRSANFEAAYGRRLEALADEWVEQLEGRDYVDAAARDVVRARFTRPSLFETRCPHYVPPYRRALQQASRALVGGDTTEAFGAYGRAVRLQPRSIEAHAGLARIRLARGEAGAVRAHLDTLGSDLLAPSVLLARGDAHAMLGNADPARADYEAALDRVPEYAREYRSLLILRRATAEAPGVTRILVSGDSSHVQAARLAARDESIAGPWQALRWQAGGRYAESVAAWQASGVTQDPERRTTPAWAERLPRAWRVTWQRQAQAWAARAGLYAGETAYAHHLATHTARAFEQEGGAAAARQLRALARRAEWASERRSAAQVAVVGEPGERYTMHGPAGEAPAQPVHDRPEPPGPIE
jgi:tetratricopeptide (TPR) repeat protein